MTFLELAPNLGLDVDPNYRVSFQLSEALSVFEEQEKEIKDNCFSNMCDVVENCPYDASRSEWYEGLRALYIKQRTNGYKRTIKRIVSKIEARNRPTRQQHRMSVADMDTARECLIEEMVDTERIPVSGRWLFKTVCPLPGHEGEKTPSFYVDKANRYKCFGCQGSGDAIQYVMETEGVDFIRAVKKLSR